MPDAVLRDEIDLALGLDYSDAPLAPRRGLDVARLHREPFLLVLPPGATPDRTSPAAVRAYADETDWILPPPTSTFGRAVRTACARAGIAPRERHLVTDTAVSIALAEAGLGITLVTPLMLAMRATTAPTAPLPGPSTRDVGRPRAHLRAGASGGGPGALRAGRGVRRGRSSRPTGAAPGAATEGSRGSDDLNPRAGIRCLSSRPGRPWAQGCAQSRLPVRARIPTTIPQRTSSTIVPTPT